MSLLSKIEMKKLIFLIWFGTFQKKLRLKEESTRTQKESNNNGKTKKK